MLWVAGTGAAEVHLLVSRAQSSTGLGALTRPVAGQLVDGQLIVTLPGSPAAATDMSLWALAPAIQRREDQRPTTERTKQTEVSSESKASS